MRCSQQENCSSTELDPFHEKPNQRMACSGDGKNPEKDSFCQLSWTRGAWQQRDEEEERLEAHFRPSGLLKT